MSQSEFEYHDKLKGTKESKLTSLINYWADKLMKDEMLAFTLEMEARAARTQADVTRTMLEGLQNEMASLRDK